MSLLDCRGQQQAITQLQSARQSGRTPHSYIFYGPTGVGKSLLARQWGKLLLCRQPIRKPWPDLAQPAPPGRLHIDQIEDCCDQCPECRLVDVGNHPDLHYITRDLVKHTEEGRNRQPIDLPIDVIREFIIEPAGRFPFRAAAAVFIVEDAHTMTRQAQNALLKTLEEPPGNTFIILISHSVEQMLSTIRSRCQSVRFACLPYSFIYESLRKSAIPEQQASYWADWCEGSLGSALHMAKMGIYETKCTMINHLSELCYDSALDFSQRLTQAAAEFAKGYQKVNPDVSQAYATRQAQKVFLEILAHAFRTALRFSASADGSVPSPDQVPQIQKIASAYDAFGCAEAIRATHQAWQQLQANVNPALLFDSIVLQYIDCASRGVPKK